MKDSVKPFLRWIRLSAFTASIGLSSQLAFSQLHFEPGAAFLLTPGSLLSVGGLTMEPSEPLVLNDLTITTGAVAQVSPASIARVYEFSAPISLQGAVGIHYLEAELNGISEKSLRIASRPDPNHAFVVAVNSLVDTTVNYVVVSFQAPTTFDRITAMSAEDGLPVKWAFFSARSENKTLVYLHWRTTEEVGTAFFAIERSRGGAGFAEVGRITTRGSAAQATDYGYEDIPPGGGTWFYRIRSVDWDGSSGLTSIRVVQMPEGAFLTELFPNPTNGKITIKGIRGAEQIMLFDGSGRLVRQEAVVDDMTELDLSGNPGGLYIVSVTGLPGCTYRIIKR